MTKLALSFKFRIRRVSRLLVWLRDDRGVNISDGGTARTGPEWISIPELASRIGMSAEGCYRLARNGELLGAIKMGRRYVVNYAAYVELSKAPITPAA
jgi:predicted DNA-binding transcriptional regulator AlpA